MSGHSVVEKCDNCGESIGRLEKAHVWGDNIVCGKCNSKLRSEDAASAGACRNCGADVAENHTHFYRGNLVCAKCQAQLTGRDAAALQIMEEDNRPRWSDPPIPLRIMFWAGFFLALFGGTNGGLWWTPGAALVFVSIVSWAIIVSAKS